MNQLKCCGAFGTDAQLNTHSITVTALDKSISASLDLPLENQKQWPLSLGCDGGECNNEDFHVLCTIEPLYKFTGTYDVDTDGYKSLPTCYEVPFYDKNGVEPQIWNPSMRRLQTQSAWTPYPGSQPSLAFSLTVRHCLSKPPKAA